MIHKQTNIPGKSGDFYCTNHGENMTESDIKSIARELAQEMAVEIARRLQKTKLVMSKPEVAEALGYQKNSSAIEKIIADPTFPRPIEISEGGRKKWRTRDIEAWLESRAQNASEIALLAAHAMR